jgi:hypothetical protein
MADGWIFSTANSWTGSWAWFPLDGTGQFLRQSLTSGGSGSAFSVKPHGGVSAMNSEGTFRFAFWVLLGLTILMRIWFAIRVRRAGERLMPDRTAIRREG